jgi:hypothetical protein
MNWKGFGRKMVRDECISQDLPEAADESDNLVDVATHL